MRHVAGMRHEGALVMKATTTTCVLPLSTGMHKTMILRGAVANDTADHGTVNASRTTTMDKSDTRATPARKALPTTTTGALVRASFGLKSAHSVWRVRTMCLAPLAVDAEREAVTRIANV